jgi:hypothetical protein
MHIYYAINTTRLSVRKISEAVRMTLGCCLENFGRFRRNSETLSYKIGLK